MITAVFFALALFACGNKANVAGKGTQPVSKQDNRPDSLPQSLDFRLFTEGIRTESVNGEKASVYILFSRDSLFADLCQPGSEAKERLQRRTLPNGKQVWNIEDDDTKNVSFANGCWTIGQRGKMLFKQSPSDNTPGLGCWVETQYAGLLPAADCRGIRYQLYIRHREHSGDGQFFLRQTYLEAEHGNDAVYTYTGRRYTLRGTSTDNDATVWQLVSDNDGSVFNFLYEDSGQTVKLLNENFEPIDCPLKRVGED